MSAHCSLMNLKALGWAPLGVVTRVPQQVTGLLFWDEVKPLFDCTPFKDVSANRPLHPEILFTCIWPITTNSHHLPFLSLSLSLSLCLCLSLSLSLPLSLPRSLYACLAFFCICAWFLCYCSCIWLGLGCGKQRQRKCFWAGYSEIFKCTCTRCS